MASPPPSPPGNAPSCAEAVALAPAPHDEQVLPRPAEPRPATPDHDFVPLRRDQSPLFTRGPLPGPSLRSGAVSDRYRSSNRRVTCPMCGRSMPVTKAGVFRIHGPLSNRCQGSGMLPPDSGPGVLGVSSAQATTDQLPQLPQSAQPSSNCTTTLLGEFSKSLYRNVRVLKRIPRASRQLAASKLASVLDSVTEHNDDASWDRLFKFSVRCFAVPKRGGKRRSLATLVNRQVQVEGDQPTECTTQPSRRTSDPLRMLSKRVSAKLEEGDYRGAVRVASSEDTMAVLSPETILALKQ